MKKIKCRSWALMMCALLMLSGCGAQASGEQSSATQAATVSAMDTTSIFSDRDLDGTYDENAAIAIALNGDSATCDSDAVTIAGSQITIGAEGVYLLSGTLTDGQICSKRRGNRQGTAGSRRCGYYQQYLRRHLCPGGG